VFIEVGRPLWWEDGSVLYNCCWSSPAQSFSGPNPVGVATIFYCLRYEIPLYVASYDSQGYGESIRPRLHTGRDMNNPELFYIRDKARGLVPKIDALEPSYPVSDISSPVPDMSMDCMDSLLLFNGSSSPFRTQASYSDPYSIFTDGRPPWTSDQPVARQLSKHRTTQIQNKHTHRHLCLEWDSNPRSQRPSKPR
jgi:hypothetical protein